MKNQSNLKQYAYYTSLNILGMLSISLYILADTFFVSKSLGADGLTALNLAIPVFNFINGVSLMLGMGGATRFSILKSRGQNEEANKVFTNTIYLASFFSLLFLIFGIFFSRQLTLVLGANKDVFSMTHTYLKVMLLFSPAFIFNGIFNCFVRNDGNPRLSTLAMASGSVSNIILDYIFIFPLQMGMFGAIFATCLSPIISMLIMSQHKIKKMNKFHLIKAKLQLRTTVDTVLLGFSSLIGEVATGVVIVVFNIIILGLRGNVGVAAYGVVSNLSLMIVAIYNGIAQGVQPLISHDYGKRNRQGIEQFITYAFITILAVSAVIYFYIFNYADGITSIFNSDNNMELQKIASQGLRVYFTAVPFLGFNIVISIIFTSMEKALPSFIISLLRGLIIIVPMAFILANLIGMLGVWLSFPVTEGIVAVIAIILGARFIGRRKRLRKKSK